MRLLDLTLDALTANLALDEALLLAAESGDGGEVLRVWESPQPAVVVGRSSRIADEVAWHACRRRGLPVLRRCSGGTAVTIGPGCLMYALVLSYERRPWLRGLDRAHSFVLDRMATAVGRLVGGVRRAGTSDLVCGDRKFSGNSLRCQRRFLLYHGTFLYDFSLDVLADCLLDPPRQPRYRAGRRHDEFVRNLAVPPGRLREAVAHEWDAELPLQGWPRAATIRLVEERYARDDWNLAR